MSPAKKSAPKRAKKAAKKPAPSSAAKKTAAKPAAKKAPAKSASRKSSQRKATARPEPTPPTEPPPAAAKGAAPKAPRARRKPTARASQSRTAAAQADERSRKPGLGLKWACFRCGAKFYDLNKPEPLCPKCGADQRERPKEMRSDATPPPAKRAPMAPMTRFLDEEEPPAEFVEEDDDAAAELDLDGLDDGAYLEVVEEEEVEEED